MADPNLAGDAQKVAEVMLLGIRVVVEDLEAGRFSLEALRGSSALTPPHRICAAVVVLNLYGDPRETEARQLLEERLSGRTAESAAGHWGLVEHYIREMRRTMGDKERGS